MRSQFYHFAQGFLKIYIFIDYKHIFSITYGTELNQSGGAVSALSTKAIP